MTSTVKPDMDKSSCKFQLINPQNSYSLKAPDVATMDQWIKAMQVRNESTFYDTCQTKSREIVTRVNIPS